MRNTLNFQCAKTARLENRHRNSKCQGDIAEGEVKDGWKRLKDRGNTELAR